MGIASTVHLGLPRLRLAVVLVATCTGCGWDCEATSYASTIDNEINDLEVVVESSGFLGEWVVHPNGVETLYYEDGSTSLSLRLHQTLCTRTYLWLDIDFAPTGEARRARLDYRASECSDADDHHLQSVRNVVDCRLASSSFVDDHLALTLSDCSVDVTEDLDESVPRIDSIQVTGSFESDMRLRLCQ
jgi:hypothetical protein